MRLVGVVNRDDRDWEPVPPLALPRCGLAALVGAGFLGPAIAAFPPRGGSDREAARLEATGLAAARLDLVRLSDFLVERGVAIHRLYIDGAPRLMKGEVSIRGEEARHAVRVKRVGEGAEVEILDGQGSVAIGRVLGARRERSGEWELRVGVGEIRCVEPVSPRVEVWSGVPKGPRVAELIEGVSQAGAAAWRGLRSERSVAEAGDQKLERLRRIASESSKQCGRAWLLEIGSPGTFEEALRAPPASSSGARLVVADAGGGPYERTGAETIRLLVGPEGGWSERELAAAREAGALLARFGPHAMRIETAAVVATAVVLDVEGRVAPI